VAFSGHSRTGFNNPLPIIIRWRVFFNECEVSFFAIFFNNPNFNTVANIASGLSVSLDYLHRGSPGFTEKEVETLREHADLDV